MSSRMFKKQEIRFSTYVGDTLALVVPVRDEDGQIVDISSGYTAVWVAKDGATTVVDSGGDTPTGVAAPTLNAQGEVILNLTSTESAGIGAGSFVVEVEITRTSDSRVETLATGVISVVASQAGVV